MDGEKLIKLVNPQITGSKGHSVYEEGCLSLPGFSENVPRAANIVVDGYDERGKPVKIETDTFLAIVLQMATAIEHVPNELTITVIYDNHILNKNIRVQIYLPQSFSARFKQDLQRYGAELIEVHDAVEVCPGVYSTGDLNGPVREQSLMLQTPKGMIVITGCAHPGIVNIIQQAKIVLPDDLLLVMGGFHLMNDNETTIRNVVSEFRESGVRNVAASHCTGDRARQMFAQEYQQHYLPAGAGSVITLKELL